MGLFSGVKKALSSVRRGISRVGRSPIWSKLSDPQTYDNLSDAIQVVGRSIKPIVDNSMNIGLVCKKTGRMLTKK